MENKLEKIDQNSFMDNFVKTDDILKDMCGIIESSQKAAYRAVNTTLINALIAEISGYTYRTKGVHIDGMMFSCSSLGVKVGGGIGTAAVGWLLNASGYVGTAATQTSGAINMIFSMYITIPVILGVVITVLLGLMTVEKENKRMDMEREANN